MQVRRKCVSNQLRGLLEVEPLHFTCCAASESTRVENMDAASSLQYNNNMQFSNNSLLEDLMFDNTLLLYDMGVGPVATTVAPTGNSTKQSNKLDKAIDIALGNASGSSASGAGGGSIPDKLNYYKASEDEEDLINNVKNMLADKIFTSTLQMKHDIAKYKGGVGTSGSSKSTAAAAGASGNGAGSSSSSVSKTLAGGGSAGGAAGAGAPVPMPSSSISGFSGGIMSGDNNNSGNNNVSTAITVVGKNGKMMKIDNPSISDALLIKMIGKVGDYSEYNEGMIQDALNVMSNLDTFEEMPPHIAALLGVGSGPAGFNGAGENCSSGNGNGGLSCNVFNPVPEAVQGDLDSTTLSALMSKRVCDFVNENLTDDGIVMAWHKLLTIPAKQMIVVDRMHSGARRHVTLDFGQPVMLTDVVSGTTNRCNASVCNNCVYVFFFRSYRPVKISSR